VERSSTLRSNEKHAKKEKQGIRTTKEKSVLADLRKKEQVLYTENTKEKNCNEGAYGVPKSPRGQKAGGDNPIDWGRERKKCDPQ